MNNRSHTMPTFSTLAITLLMFFGLHAAVDLASAEEAFHSGGFARAPEGALDIANAPAPLFRDPVTNGAADPSVVWNAKEKAWYVFYTQRRANAALPPAESWYMGTKIAIAKSADQGRSWNYVGTAQGLSRGLKEETFWAPHVFEDNGTWHLFVTFIPKVVKSAKGQPEICHYTSRDLVKWEYSDTVDVKSDDIIDPGVVKLRDGRWLMVFRDCRQQNRTAKVVSTDLKNWQRLEDLTGSGAHEAPVVLFWKNKFWMFIDEWKGIGVYESDDGIKYTQNSLILDKAGKRADDGYWGSHPGVALAGDRAFVFYHVHAGRKIGVNTPALDQKGIEFKRTSLQVAELELKDGKIVCDRDKYLFKHPQMPAPAGQGGSLGVSVCQFGAKGDGVTDDTDAIQAAINHVSEKGGGRILFPYTRTGYRIAKPAVEAVEAVDGRPCRGQLHIPFKPGWDKANIAFEGEMPCSLLYTYQVRDATPTYGGVTEFANMPCSNTYLFSDWKAPEEHDPTARPWTLLATVEGDLYAGKFGCQQVSIRNLEFRVPLDTEKMYPTTSAVNLQNAGRVNIQDSQFCLDKNIGDGKLGKELQPNPCHVVGLMTSGDQNDNQVLRNVAVQGFRYGFVLGEHSHADYLYVHNCEEGIVFHDSTHLSVIEFVVAQHNTRIITTTRDKLFGHCKGECNVSFGYVNFEAGDGTKPAVSALQHGVYDPENRLRGTLRWHTPWGRKEFPVEGAKNLKISQYPD